MGKRFTDTDKWKRPWFRNLSTRGKLIWLYLCDQCDHAGVWLTDFETATIQLGFKLDERELFASLGNKVVKVDADKFCIPSFYEYQYADAKEGFKAKQSAQRILQKLGILNDSGDRMELSPKCSEVSPNTPEQSGDCPSISISIGIGNSEGGAGETKFTPDPEGVYKRYPLKLGKAEGLKRLEKQIVSRDDQDAVHRALDRFLAHHRAKGTDPKFYPYFSTWVSSWRDWLDPTVGTAESLQPTFDITKILERDVS